MKQITKIVVHHAKIKIYHSNHVIDKKQDYRIGFDSYYKGCEDFVKKDYLLKTTPITYQLESIIYVPTSKFTQNESYWISIATEDYRKKFAKYNWFKEPVLH